MSGRALRMLGLLTLLLVSLDGWARVGGGQDYSGGGGSYDGGGSSGSYGGSSGGDLGGLVYLLVRLCIEAPIIGIPLTVVVLGVVFYAKSQGGGNRNQRWTPHHPQQGQGGPRPRRGDRQGARAELRKSDLIRQLTKLDPNFSLPLFLDWVNLVYVRGHESRAKGDAERLAEHFAAGAVNTLFQGREGIQAVQDIIVGASSISGVRVEQDRVYVEIAFESNLTEQRAAPTTLLLEERWIFSRKTGVLSPGPDKLRTLGCPSCGSTLDAKADGRCPNCETMRAGGESQWQVTRIQLLSKKAITPPTLGSSGVEAGTTLPTRFDPELSVERRRFDAGHPEHSWAAFRTRVEEVFRRLQHAWDAGRWEEARPYETDSLFQQHRFWMERYKRFGLRNRLDDIQVRNVEVVKIQPDAFYEAVTVRLHGSMKDWTMRTSDDKVVSGSPDKVRQFSEYWTFIRTIGTQHKESFDAEHCPSCAAPLDKVSMAGVCGYCEAKIVTGDFDWVLSRIEQDESYEG